MSGGMVQDPPNNLAAERSLLGAVLLDNRLWHKVNDLGPEAFYREPHQRLWVKASEAIEAGGVADPVALSHWAKGSDGLAGIDEPMKFLVSLAADAGLASNVRHYADILSGLARKRDIVAAAQEIAMSGSETDISVDALMSRWDELTTSVATSERYRKEARWWSEITDSAMKQWQASARGDVVSVPTGLTDVDRALGGLFPSDLIILAGRPSMGKTAFAQSIAINAAKRFQDEGGAVLFFSLEQPDEQLVTRDISGLSGIEMTNIRAGILEDWELKRLLDMAAGRAGLPILVDDRPGLSMGQISAAARRHVKNSGVRLIIVDYLQLIQASKRYEGNKVNEIGEITNALKNLAKELDLPVIALSQLSRALESRDNKRPMMSDLRDSGSIEQDADVIVFLYREEYYLTRDGEPKEDTYKSGDSYQTALTRWHARMQAAANKAEVIISKNRNGGPRNVEVRFEANRMAFENLGVLL